MHIEVLTEDSSGKVLLEHLLPKLIGRNGEPHSWRVTAYRGIGRIPPSMKSGDPAKRILLDQLPRVLGGYAKTPDIDAVVVVLDADDRDCAAFLAELRYLAASRGAEGKTMFRLAIEETDAWYFGDPNALQTAYPKARKAVLKRYRQDAVCGTWEMLAGALHPGKPGGPLPGDLKHEWANRIGPLMNPDANRSPSFIKLRDGLRRLVAAPAIQPGQTPSG
nr:hypothetical protein [uncultured Rhodopila sp.]